MKHIVLIFVTTFFLLGCKKQKVASAQDIVDKSIEVSGGAIIKNATITFDFRDIHYTAMRKSGVFKLERKFKDSTNTIQDILSNNGFERIINGKTAEVIDSMVTKYSASVNSVHYFSVLPYGLNDAAVNKEYIEEVNLKGKQYHKIKITFNQDGGGEDFEDVFVYWINSKTFKVEYIAYSYEEVDGTGLRFRAAYNERYVNGVRFVDYNNYKPAKSSVLVENLDDLFEKNQLQLLSKIELENITVN